MSPGDENALCNCAWGLTDVLEGSQDGCREGRAPNAGIVEPGENMAGMQKIPKVHVDEPGPQNTQNPAVMHDREPVRIIHHLSCTGGTLIAKCLAAMPNVLLLNEVDPLSPLPFASGGPSFSPTDMIALLRQGDPDIDAGIIERVFIAEIDVIRRELSRTGRALVLRDHSHSHFLTGKKIPSRPAVGEIVQSHFPVRSVVTVRDPVDSYLSLRKHGWNQHFAPPTFDEYCRRYLIFLEKYKGVDIIKYEDFVADPHGVMQQMCALLDLEYSDLFIEVFDVFNFSGDSGRSGNVIEARARRTLDESIKREIWEARFYPELVGALEYEFDRELFKK